MGKVKWHSRIYTLLYYLFCVITILTYSLLKKVIVVYRKEYIQFGCNWFKKIVWWKIWMKTLGKAEIRFKRNSLTIANKKKTGNKQGRVNSIHFFQFESIQIQDSNDSNLNRFKFRFNGVWIDSTLNCETLMIWITYN